MRTLRGLPLLEWSVLLAMLGATLWLLAGKDYLFAAVPSLAVFFFFMISRYPAAGYALIVFLVPFDSLRSAIDLRSLSLSKFVGIWLLLVLFVYLVINRSDKYDVRSKIWPYLILFFVVNLVSALLSQYSITSIDNLRQLLTVYAFFLLTIALVTPAGLRTWLPRVLITSITLNSFFAIIGFMFHITSLSMDLRTMTRATGFTNDPNFFSSMALFGLPLLVNWIFYAPTKAEKRVAPFFFIINIVAIAISYSRAAFIILVLVLLFLAVEHAKKVTPRIIGLALLVCTVAGIVFSSLIPQDYWKYQKTVASLEDASIGRRVSYLYTAWDIFKEDPLLGVGPGAFKEFFSKTRSALQFAGGSEDVDQYRRYAHNTYVEVLTGSGALGLVCFLAILVMSVRNFNLAVARLSRLNMGEVVSLLRSYRMAHLIIMAYFFFISSPYHKYLWLPLALSVVALRLSDDLTAQADVHKKQETSGGYYAKHLQ